MPKRGVLVDEFYLVYMKGFWAQLCNFIPITGGVIQYLILSIIAVNRLVVIVWSTKIQRVGIKKCFVLEPHFSHFLTNAQGLRWPLSS